MMINQDDIVKYKNYIEGSKFADISGFLKKTAFVCDLEIQIDAESRGWFSFSETVYYIVTGKRKIVNEFRKIIVDSVNHYNQQIDNDYRH